MTNKESESLRSEVLSLIGPCVTFLGGDGLDWITDSNDRDQTDKQFYSRLLKNFVHMDFTEAEAIDHWKNILAATRETETLLGKKVSVYTAVVDYFTNEKALLDSPILIEIRVFRQTEQMAMIDGLTGIFNRRYMETILKKEFTRCERYGKRFSVCLLDIDDFKKVNDTMGHVFGDRVLKELSSLLRSSVREEDIVCRYGGEEFLIILPETDADGAIFLGRRIQQYLKESRLFSGNGITLSAGTATFPDNARDLDWLIRAADDALYQAKLAGKDRIISATPERRKFDRFEQKWQFDICDDKSEARCASKTHNISLGGIQFESKEKYSLHTNLHMIFSNQEDQTDGVEADGHITWVQKNREYYRYGVRFDDTPELFGEKFIQEQKTVQQTL